MRGARRPGLGQFPEKKVFPVEGIFSDEFLGTCGVLPAKGLDDLRVLPYRPFDPPGHRGDEAEPLKLHDQVPNDRVELVISAGAKEDLVKLVVQIEHATQILFCGRRLYLPVDRFHLRQVVFRKVLRRKPRCVPLEDHLQFVEVRNVLRRNRGDDRPLAGNHRDEPFGLQLPNRLPDGSPADAEPLRKLRLHDPRARADLAVHDRGPDCGEDPLAQRPLVVDANFQLLQKGTPAKGFMLSVYSIQ